MKLADFVFSLVALLACGYFLTHTLAATSIINALARLFPSGV